MVNGSVGGKTIPNRYLMSPFVQPSSSVDEPDNVLHLAVTMAGAVSAGSYTAGVMDYLLEALDAWERAKKTGDVRIPSHQVCIELLNGTSAGGMTAVVAATALHDTITPVSPLNKQQGKAQTNKLYNSWVELTGDDNLLPKMLLDDDIVDGEVPSLLNSTFIEQIADKIVEQVHQDAQPIDRPYIAKNLEVMVTLTNLSGIRYSTFFGPDVRDAFVGTNHLDYGHFVFSDSLDDTTGRIPVSLKNKDDCTLLRQTAMATGAFPLGLSARSVSRKLQFIRNNPYINLDHPAFTQSDITDPYDTINVDGGVLNNEPFDRAEEIFNRKFGLKDQSTRTHTLKDPDHFRCSILMIDPFPSTDYSEQKLDVSQINDIMALVNTATNEASVRMTINETLKEFEVNNGRLSPEQRQQLIAILKANVSSQARILSFEQGLVALNRETKSKPNVKSLAGLLFRATRNQLLFKKEDISQAFDKEDYSRFMIVPKQQSIRANGLTKISGSKAIACGSFGGFGGFVSRKFREHDFFLGRMNCKRFLQKHFGIPVTALEVNPIFNGAYTPEALLAFAYEDSERKDSENRPLKMVPIIPLVDVQFQAAPPEEPLPWPYLPESDLYALRNRFKQRSRAVLNGLFKPKSKLWKPLVGLGVWAFDGKVADTILESIIDDFREYRLLEATDDVSRDA